MSLLSPETGKKNPVKKFLKWKASKGCFSFYDKETKMEELVQLPLEFTVIEDMNIVGGYSEKYGKSIYSNMTKSIKTPFSVKAGDKLIAFGLWSNPRNEKINYEVIGEKVKSAGGKFGKRLFVISNGELMCIDLIGSSFSAWLDSEVNIDKYNVKIASTKAGKKGSNSWEDPVFDEGSEISLNIADPEYAPLVSFLNLTKSETVSGPTPTETAVEEVFGDTEERPEF